MDGDCDSPSCLHYKPGSKSSLSYGDVALTKAHLDKNCEWNSLIPSSLILTIVD